MAFFYFLFESSYHTFYKLVFIIIFAIGFIDKNTKLNKIFFFPDKLAIRWVSGQIEYFNDFSMLHDYGLFCVLEFKSLHQRFLKVIFYDQLSETDKHYLAIKKINEKVCANQIN